MKPATWLFSLAFIALAACNPSSEPRTGDISELKVEKRSAEKRDQAKERTCDLGKMTTSSFAKVSTMDASGRVIDGRLTSTQASQLGHPDLWAAFAFPTNEFPGGQVVREDFCTRQNADGRLERKRWPDCVFRLIYELGDVYGIGRAGTSEGAKTLALANCEEVVAKLKERYDELGQVAVGDDLACMVEAKPC